MTTTARRAAASATAIIAALGWTSRAAAAESRLAIAGQPSLTAPDRRVRGVGPRLVAVISEAATRSTTFRGLVDQINRTDGIVYVTEGQCGHGVRACLLLTMTVMGPHRVLRILVDPRKVDFDLMGSIGHELQHAVEVLSDSRVRSSSDMVIMYQMMAPNPPGSPFRFETMRAVQVGDAVRDELRRAP